MPKLMILGLCLIAAGTYTGAAYAHKAEPRSDQATNILPGSPERADQLPAPQTSTDDVSGLLDDASKALAAGHTGEAQEALEEAETRALDRSVPATDNHNAISDPLVTDVSQARQDLGNKDITGAQHQIDLARTAASSS